MDALIEVREFANPADLTAHMSLGTTDVGVTSRPAEWPGDMCVLGHEELLVAVAMGDPAVRRNRRVRLADLSGRSWVLYAQENGLTEVIETACATAGFAPRAAVRVHHTATAVQLAAAGLGPALVPQSTVERDFRGVLLRPDPAVRQELVALFAHDSSDSTTHFVETLVAGGALRRRA